MEKLSYDALSKEIIDRLREENGLILATCADNRVTARMICHVNDGLDILFATDRNSLKVAQMRKNPNIALAVGNMRIEAVAELFGHPSGHPFFTAAYPKKFPQFGEQYPSAPDDMLVIARPGRIALYKYIDGPREDTLDVAGKNAYRTSL